ncbi:MAG: hypothetical protein WHT46_10505 [Candidatus Geothermincolales bacterium]
MNGSITSQAGAQQPERVLFSFGPLGVSVCKGCYSMWKWQRKNSTVIELTTLGIKGVPRCGLSSRAFEIPYSSIASLQVYGHPARLGLMQVLDIRYWTEAGIQELSICTYNQNVLRACEVLASFAVPIYASRS